jgi:oligopeptide/dipeptide ABC transporter ATP-binding protein
MTSGPAPTLEVTDLRVEIATRRGVVVPADGVSYTIGAGEIVALVGETGSGKTLTALATIGLLPPRARIVQGRILFGDVDLARASEGALRRIRGAAIGYVPQDATAALNPVLKIGTQLTEPLRAHLGLSAGDARERAVGLLASVGIPEPRNRLDAYPHELSGGTCQRVAIAIALSCDPRLIIADEPTTALDVTVQAQVVDLLLSAAHRRHLSVLLISHDIGLVSSISDRTLVMYAARIVEHSPTGALVQRPAHPYTEALLMATPRIRMERRRRLTVIPGRPPDLRAPPPGCRFHPRCPYAEDVCRDRDPSDGAGDVACWFPRTERAASRV